MRFFPVASVAILVMAVVHARAELITSEFFSVPVDEGWTLLGNSGELTTWIDDGIYYQQFGNNCEPGPVCGTEAFTRPIDAFNGNPHWFYEFRVSATGDSSEIPNGAPSGLSAFNAFGNIYQSIVSSNQIELSGWPGLPIVFLDVEPGPHSIRVELFNDPPSATFRWYVDSVLVLDGPANTPFPDFDSRIVWVGRTWMQPTLNKWFYIRAGDIPLAASGDFNTDGAVDDFEVFYINECIERSAAGEPAAPSCTWADIDADGTVECVDWQIIADTLWTGANDPPPLPNCTGLAPIPAVSHWGVVVLMLSLGIAGSVLFKRHLLLQG